MRLTWLYQCQTMVIGGIILCALSGCAANVPGTNNPKVIEANTLKNQGRLDAALAALDQAIRDNPQDAIAWNNRGQLYVAKGAYNKAVGDYNRALSITEAGVFYANRGDAYRYLRQQEQAMADYKKALAFGYQTPVVFAGIGAIHLHQAHDAEAVDAFTNAIMRNEKEPSYYGQRGIALVHLARYQEALADFERYLPTAPQDGRALRWQGDAFLRTGQTARAQENVRKLIELEPRLAVNFSRDRALDLYDLDKRRTMTKQALAAAREAESTGQWTEAFQQYERARTWVTGETEQDRTGASTLLEGLRRAYANLPTKPDLPEAARRFGIQAVSLAEQKHYAEAVTLYEKAFGIAPWWPEGYFNSALLLADQHRFAEAITKMNAYLELVPNSPDARAARDKIYEWEVQLSHLGLSTDPSHSTKTSQRQ